MSLLKLLSWPRFATVLLSVFCAHAAHATPIAVPKQHVLIEVKGRYGTQWTKVFKDGSGWACQTNLLPYYEAKSDPLKGLSWKEVRSLVGEIDPSCNSQLTVIDLRNTHPIRIEGCMGDPKLDQWIASVHDRCGRR